MFLRRSLFVLVILCVANVIKSKSVDGGNKVNYNYKIPYGQQPAPRPPRPPPPPSAVSPKYGYSADKYSPKQCGNINVVIPPPPKQRQCFDKYDIVCTLSASISLKSVTGGKSTNQSCNNYKNKTNSFVGSTPVAVDGGPKYAPKCQFCCQYYAIENYGKLNLLNSNWTPQDPRDIDGAIGTCACCFAKEVESCDYIAYQDRKYKVDKHRSGKYKKKAGGHQQDDSPIDDDEENEIEHGDEAVVNESNVD